MRDAYRTKRLPWVSDVHEPDKMQPDQNPCLYPTAETQKGQISETTKGYTYVGQKLENVNQMISKP